MTRSLCSLIWLLALHLMVLEPKTWAGWSLVLPGRIDRVVSAGDRTAAIRGKAVFFLDDNGSILKQLPDRETESHRFSQSSDVREDNNALDFLGIDESRRDEAWVEDELNNESTLKQRRARRERRSHEEALAGPHSPRITASGHDIWIAHDHGLWYWPADGELVRVTQRNLASARLSASSDGQVLVAVDNQIWLFTGRDGTRRMVATTDGVRHVAFSASGRSMAWSNGTRLERRDNTDGPAQVVFLPKPARDLLYCEETLLLLFQDGLAKVDPQGVLTLLAPGLAARRLSCPGGFSPWLASGPDLLLSDDHGLTWTSMTLPVSAGRVLDAAMGEDCLWIATDRGLYRVTDGSTHDPMTLGPFQQRPRLLGPQVAPWWAAWLPRLSIGLGAAMARGRRDIRTVALASFPLDTPTHRSSFRLVADSPEGPAAPVSQSVDVTLPPDPEASCLTAIRAKAVALAMVEPERGQSYVSRARRAAWLPELRLRIDRRFGRSESLDIPSTSTSVTSPLGVDTVDDVRYEARVTWDLGRLVFSNDELAAQAQTMRMTEIRRDIEVTVSRLYFERRRLRLDRLPSGPGERTLRRDLRIREIEAELDALSGGGFSQCIAGRTTGQGDS